MDASNCSIGYLLTRGAKYFPKVTALVTEDKRLTYAEINDRTNRLANGLLTMGVKKGDHIAILFPNSHQFVESNFAVIKAGANLVPLNTRLAASELAYMIDNSDSTLVIYDVAFSDVIASIRSKLPKVKQYICDGETVPEDTLSYEELIAKSPAVEPDVYVPAEEGRFIYYTAGTTGLPKGAFKSTLNALWNAVSVVIQANWRDRDVALGFPPFFHIAGWECLVLPAFIVGGTVVTARAFDPVKALEAIQNERVTVVFLIPTMSIAMFNVPDVDKYDLSSLRLFNSVAAPTPVALKRKIMGYLPNVNFMESIGLTETGGVAHLPPIDAVRKAVCVGIPEFHLRVQIVDDEGKDVPQGEVGEVVVQGPGVIKGYYNDPEKTGETIRQGWFHTGDLAKTDEEGYIYIVDRKKDMVLTGGENVYSAEVENVIFKHPKVLEASVIGLPHERWGEQVTAVVTLKPGEEMTERELIDFCRESLAGYKCPKEVKFLQEPLPKTSFGKVLKRELRERFSS